MYGENMDIVEVKMPVSSFRTICAALWQVSDYARVYAEENKLTFVATDINMLEGVAVRYSVDKSMPKIEVPLARLNIMREVASGIPDGEMIFNATKDRIIIYTTDTKCRMLINMKNYCCPEPGGLPKAYKSTGETIADGDELRKVIEICDLFGNVTISIDRNMLILRTETKYGDGMSVEFKHPQNPQNQQTKDVEGDVEETQTVVFEGITDMDRINEVMKFIKNGNVKVYISEGAVVFAFRSDGLQFIWWIRHEKEN